MQISQEEISVQDSKIKFTNAQQFSEFMGKSVGTDLSEDYFPKIQRFEKSGFVSLVPLYDADDEENVNNYYLKLASSLKSGDIDDIPLDSLEYEDEFICDPYFSALLNEKKELDTQPTVIVSSKPDDDIEFTYENWKKHKTKENKITEIFDWNTGQIGFKYNIGGVGGWSDASIDPSKLMTAKSYKEARILAYGMGRIGSTWKGAQVNFKDTK